MLAEQLADPATLAIALAAVAQSRLRPHGWHPARPPRPCARARADPRWWRLRGRGLVDLARRSADAPVARARHARAAARPIRSPRRVARSVESADRRGQRAGRSRRRQVPVPPRPDGDGGWRMGHGRAAVRRGDSSSTRQIGLEVFEPLCLSILAEIDAYRGETEKARSDDPRAAPSRRDGHVPMGRLPPADRTRGPRAVLRRWRRELAASRSCSTTSEELDVYLARLAGSAGIEALLAIGDLRQAERLLAQLDRRAADGDAALRPLVLRCRGLLLAAQGDRRTGDRGARGGGASRPSRRRK